MHSIGTREFDNFTCVFDNFTHMFKILVSLLTCISNMLQALPFFWLNSYQFTHEFFACTIQAGVNIFVAGEHYHEIMTSKQCGMSMTFSCAHKVD